MDGKKKIMRIKEKKPDLAVIISINIIIFLLSLLKNTVLFFSVAGMFIDFNIPIQFFNIYLIEVFADYILLYFYFVHKSFDMLFVTKWKEVEVIECDTK